MIKSSKFHAFLVIIYFISLVLDLTRFGVSDFMQLSIKSIVHGLIFILFIRQVKLNDIQLRLGFFIKAYLIIAFLSLLYTVSILETLKGLVSLPTTIMLIILFYGNSSMDKVLIIIRKLC